MSEKLKTHWKKTIDKDWIGTYILPEGKPIIVRLISVKFEEVKVKGIKDWYKVAYFAKNKYFDKPMLLSATKNLKRLETLTGTPYIEDWVTLNIDVILQQEMDQAFGGGKDWALRIAPNPPTKRELTPLTVEMIPKAINFIKGGKTINDLKDKYSFSIEIEKQIIDGCI